MIDEVAIGELAIDALEVAALGAESALEAGVAEAAGAASAMTTAAAAVVTGPEILRVVFMASAHRSRRATDNGRAAEHRAPAYDQGRGHHRLEVKTGATSTRYYLQCQGDWAAA